MIYLSGLFSGLIIGFLVGYLATGGKLFLDILERQEENWNRNMSACVTAFTFRLGSLYDEDGTLMDDPYVVKAMSNLKQELLHAADRYADESFDARIIH